MKVHLLQGKKTLDENRELEVFKLLQKENASISDGTLFKKIALISVKSK